jgi:hypothetical protein
VPRAVKRLWGNLRAQREKPLTDDTWCDVAIKLLAISDEAAGGIGFMEGGPLADYLLYQHQRRLIKKTRRSPLDLPYLPHSLCRLVPPDQACVQPKTMTPSVGCTLRSLSHNLALLPPVGEVETRWLFGTGSSSNKRALNLLLVPLPYELTASCFTGESVDQDGSGRRLFRFFDLEQRWLNEHRDRTVEISKFLIALIEQAQKEVAEVHGVVLPECALEYRLARRIGREIARRTPLELFISGIAARAETRDDPQNAVYTCVFYNHRLLQDWRQSKHHRWRLDGAQIRRYHLGSVLDPDHAWWERIAVPQRTCNFYVFRHGASLAALVCEDLARIDPVQVALRSIGPNLVVVLLLDGPQLEHRWPGKYATVLAEDPGCAVLTLTCLGMVRRAAGLDDHRRHDIALWRDSRQPAQSLELPRGAQALLLSLTQSEVRGYSMDGRSDRGNTVRLSLGGVSPVTHPDPPRWAIID